MIGLGGKGRSHVKMLVKFPGARLTALCDVDPQRLAEQVAVAKEAGLTVNRGIVVDDMNEEALGHARSAAVSGSCASGTVK